MDVGRFGFQAVAQRSQGMAELIEELGSGRRRGDDWSLDGGGVEHGGHERALWTASKRLGITSRDQVKFPAAEPGELQSRFL